MPENGMPSPSAPVSPGEMRGWREEVRSLREKLLRAEREVECGICRDLMRAPVSLRCGHSFCSECARRALMVRSRCPEAHCAREATTAELRPVRALEAVAGHLRPGAAGPATPPPSVTPARARLVPLPASSRAALVPALRAVGLRADGTADRLAQRYREFVVRWNANLDSARPQPEAVVAAQVVAAERALAAAAQRAGGSTITNLFRKRRAPPPAAGGDDLPAEGDSFETQIRKMRRREGRGPPVRRPRPPTPPQTPPRESPSDFDLALIDAADRASQSQDAAHATPPTPRTRTPPRPPWMLGDDRARPPPDSRPPAAAHFPSTPPRPAGARPLWGNDDNSLSTLAPSPARAAPSPARSGAGPSRVLTPVRGEREPPTRAPAATRSPAAQPARPRIHVTPWRPFPGPGAAAPAPPAPRAAPAAPAERIAASAPPAARNPQLGAWRQNVPNAAQPRFSQSQTPTPPGGLSQGRRPLTDAQRARIARNREQAIAKQLAARRRREMLHRGAGRPPA